MHSSCVLAAAMLFAACDIPTAIPEWDTTFIVNAESTTLSVGQVLPSSLTVLSTSAGFGLSLSPATFTETLNSLCATCALVSGESAPKPAFTAALSTTIPLPADVAAGDLSAGIIHLSVRNGFSFDPLRPATQSAVRGELTARVHSGTTTVGSVTISGADASLAPDAAISFAVPLRPGFIASELTVTVTLVSPVGAPVRMNGSDMLTIVAKPDGLKLSSAQIKVANRQITAAPVQLKLAGIDDYVKQRARVGSLPLTISNSFGLTGTLSMTITGGSSAITKPVQLKAGLTTVDVSFNENELHSILGYDVNISLAGPVSAASNVSVTPGQLLSISSQLKLILGPGQ